MPNSQSDSIGDYPPSVVEYLNQLQERQARMMQTHYNGYGIPNPQWVGIESVYSEHPQPAPRPSRTLSSYEEHQVNMLKRFFDTGIPDDFRVGYVDEGVVQLYLEGNVYRILEEDNAFLIPGLSEAMTAAVERLAIEHGFTPRVEEYMSGTSFNGMIVYYNFNRQDDVDDSALLEQVENRRPRQEETATDEEIPDGPVFTNVRWSSGTMTF